MPLGRTNIVVTIFRPPVVIRKQLTEKKAPNPHHLKSETLFVIGDLNFCFFQIFLFAIFVSPVLIISSSSSYIAEWYWQNDESSILRKKKPCTGESVVMVFADDSRCYLLEKWLSTTKRRWISVLDLPSIIFNMYPEWLSRRLWLMITSLQFQSM